MKVNGLKTSRKEEEAKDGLMGVNIKDCIKMVRSTVKANLLGKTVQPTLEIGFRIRCTAMDFSCGLTVETMKVSIKMIGSTVGVFLGTSTVD